MSSNEIPNGEELIDESGRNATQRQLDADGVEDVPLDTDWAHEPRPGGDHPVTEREELA